MIIIFVIVGHIYYHPALPCTGMYAAMHEFTTKHSIKTYTSIKIKSIFARHSRIIPAQHFYWPMYLSEGRL